MNTSHVTVGGGLKDDCFSGRRSVNERVVAWVGVGGCGSVWVCAYTMVFARKHILTPSCLLSRGTWLLQKAVLNVRGIPSLRPNPAMHCTVVCLKCATPHLISLCTAFSIWPLSSTPNAIVGKSGEQGALAMPIAQRVHHSQAHGQECHQDCRCPMPEAT